MENFIKRNAEEYKRLLARYLESQDEESLYGVEQVSKAFIKQNILPEEIVNLHIGALKELHPNVFEEFEVSMDFLLEAMISYGLAHQEIQNLKEEQIALKSEMALAAEMQETILRTQKPDIEGLDIGIISVPANQLNGDYHHFIKNNDGSLGLAMADVIGKGVPAALCMSMIKYSMDSMLEESLSPRAILRNLNRVVEKNVDASMFITMVYAHYYPETCELLFSSAGHEPGFYYDASKDTFSEITSKGLVLGVMEEVEYEERRLTINKNDLVIFLTDGVTECRDGDRFIEIDEVLDVIRKYVHLPAQEIVEAVFKHFEKLQDFHLKDDFSLLILRKQFSQDK
ncbi:PP2C family protein-serine/threonine phosphatase [Oceanobacillus sp. CAU 1775]